MNHPLYCRSCHRGIVLMGLTSTCRVLYSEGARVRHPVYCRVCHSGGVSVNHPLYCRVFCSRGVVVNHPVCCCARVFVCACCVMLRVCACGPWFNLRVSRAVFGACVVSHPWEPRWVYAV